MAEALVEFLRARLDEIERLARGAAEAAPLRTGDMDGEPAGSRWASDDLGQLYSEGEEAPWSGDGVFSLGVPAPMSAHSHAERVAGADQTLAAVLDLHAPKPGGTYGWQCEGCDGVGDYCADWPCRTYQLIAGWDS